MPTWLAVIGFCIFGVLAIIGTAEAICNKINLASVLTAVFVWAFLLFVLSCVVKLSSLR